MDINHELNKIPQHIDTVPPLSLKTKKNKNKKIGDIK